MTSFNPAVDADALLAGARRRLSLARAAHWALLLIVAVGLATGPLLGLDWLAVPGIAAVFVWVMLVARSAKLARQVRAAWSAANLGRLDAAEAGARDAISAWTLLRPTTLTAANVLGLVAHRQGRHAEAARYCAFVLARGERLVAGDRVSTQLLLVDALLAMGQVPAAQAAAMPLYAGRLSLPDALALLSLQLRLEARLGAYAAMVDRLPQKVDMAELMPPAEAARAQALLLLAAQRAGLTPWAAWLRRRVGLLGDWPALVIAEPVLAEVAPPPATTDISPVDAPAARDAGGGVR